MIDWFLDWIMISTESTVRGSPETELSEIDSVAFSAAVCLGRFGVHSKQAEAKLRQAVATGNKHMKAQAMEILVRQMNVKDQQIIHAILDQVCNDI